MLEKQSNINTPYCESTPHVSYHHHCFTIPPINERTCWYRPDKVHCTSYCSNTTCRKVEPVNANTMRGRAMLVIVVPIADTSCPLQSSMKLRFLKSERCCASIQIILETGRWNCGRLWSMIDAFRWTRERSENRAYIINYT